MLDMITDNSHIATWCNDTSLYHDMVANWPMRGFSLPVLSKWDKYPVRRNRFRQKVEPIHTRFGYIRKTVATEYDPFQQNTNSIYCKLQEGAWILKAHKLPCAAKLYFFELLDFYKDRLLKTVTLA